MPEVPEGTPLRRMISQESPLVDHVDWRWVFYLNVPFGFLAAGVIAYQLFRPRRTDA